LQFHLVWKNIKPPSKKKKKNSGSSFVQYLAREVILTYREAGKLSDEAGVTREIYRKGWIIRKIYNRLDNRNRLREHALEHIPRARK